MVQMSKYETGYMLGYQSVTCGLSPRLLRKYKHLEDNVEFNKGYVDGCTDAEEMMYNATNDAATQYLSDKY